MKEFQQLLKRDDNFAVKLNSSEAKEWHARELQELEMSWSGSEMRPLFVRLHSVAQPRKQGGNGCHIPAKIAAT